MMRYRITGVVGGFAPASIFAGSEATAQRSSTRGPPPSTAVAKPETVEAPRWWIEPAEQDQPIDGHLYFEVVVRNPGDRELSIEVSFGAYTADGTPYPGCSSASARVAPDDRAAIFCTRTIAPLRLRGLQVTARLQDIRILDSRSSTVVRATDVTLLHASPALFGNSAFFASTLLHATTNSDSYAGVVFRFYDDKGIQLDTCESAVLVVQPEVAVKATCSDPVLLPAAISAPAKVTAEVRVPR